MQDRIRCYGEQVTATMSANMGGVLPETNKDVLFVVRLFSISEAILQQESWPQVGREINVNCRMLGWNARYAAHSALQIMETQQCNSYIYCSDAGDGCILSGELFMAFEQSCDWFPTSQWLLAA